MLQQINLFRFVKLPIKSVLDLRFLLELYGGFFVLLLLIFILSFFQTSRMSVVVDDSKIAVEAKRKELVALAELYPQSNIPTQILDATRLPMCNTKFSSYLEGFSQAYVPGIWLTEINISNNGQGISLKGHALRALQVQQYLLHLKQQTTFAKLSFDIQNLNDQPPPISFEVIGRPATHG